MVVVAMVVVTVLVLVVGAVVQTPFARVASHVSHAAGSHSHSQIEVLDHGTRNPARCQSPNASVHKRASVDLEVKIDPRSLSADEKNIVASLCSTLEIPQWQRASVLVSIARPWGTNRPSLRNGKRGPMQSRSQIVKNEG